MNCLTILAQLSVTQTAVIIAFACVAIVSVITSVMLLKQWRQLR